MNTEKKTIHLTLMADALFLLIFFVAIAPRASPEKTQEIWSLHERIKHASILDVRLAEVNWL